MPGKNITTFLKPAPKVASGYMDTKSNKDFLKIFNSLLKVSALTKNSQTAVFYALLFAFC